jgi:hypothetical protein
VVVTFLVVVVVGFLVVVVVIFFVVVVVSFLIVVVVFKTPLVVVGKAVAINLVVGVTQVVIVVDGEDVLGGCTIISSGCLLNKLAK